MILKGLFLISFMIILGGCPIMTRSQMSEAEEKRELQEQVTTLQKENSEVATRYADVEEELRRLNGRIEVLERENEKYAKAAQEGGGDQNKKLQALQEEVTHLNEQVATLSAELAATKGAGSANAKKEGSKNSWEAAEELFESKDWKQAILGYQKFRDKNPTSKRLPEATYKIGVSFQELGMKDEAKTFFDEVVDRFPESKEAKKAKIRLKSLKK